MNSPKTLALVVAIIIGCVAEFLFIGIPNVPVMIREHAYVGDLKPGLSRTQLVARAQALNDPDLIGAGDDTPATNTYAITFYSWTQFMVERGETITMTFSKDGKLVSWRSKPVRLY